MKIRFQVYMPGNILVWCMHNQFTSRKST